MSLFGICVVDGWMLYSGAHGAAAVLTHAQFHETLAEQLIDNVYHTRGASRCGVLESYAAADETTPPLFGVSVHLTPTLKRRTGSSAKGADQRAQRDCRVCKSHRTTQVCSRCRETGDGEVYCCGPKAGHDCFEVHMRDVHQLNL